MTNTQTDTQAMVGQHMVGIALSISHQALLAVLVMSANKYIPVISTAFSALICLQCFDAVGWASGRASGL